MTRAKLLETLTSLQTHVPSKECGICYNVKILMWEDRDEACEWLAEKFPLWPEFSGDNEFPVGCGHTDPEYTYNTYGDLWDNSEYGNARRRLLQFLIDEVQKEIENESRIMES